MHMNSIFPMKNFLLLGLVGAALTGLARYVPESPAISSFVISALIFGFVVGLFIVRQKQVTRLQFFKSWGWSASAYFVAMMLVEVFKYQPWHKLSLDGHLVNLFVLRSVYNSGLIVFFVLLSLLAASLPLLFSHHVWKNFKPLGVSKK